MLGRDTVQRPVVIGGARVIPPFIDFLRDPIRTALCLSATHGDFVEFRIPFAVGRMPSSVIFTAAAPHFREILGNPATWRTVNIAAAGRARHSSSRLSRGLVRMRGARHEHYRRLIAPPLRRASVHGTGDRLGRTAERICGHWPRDETVDLQSLCRAMMREMAAVHLFGGGDVESLDIARLISAYVAASWSLSINLLRLNLPGMPYRQFLLLSERLEAAILHWAMQKKGEVDPQDLLSIIVNSTDENGNPPSESVIAGHVPTLFGAAYETCQNALIWLLVLISQHPRIEQCLRDEIAEAVGDGPIALAKVDDLPFLDAVIKEGFRILPPVPNQYRVALCDTSLSGFPVAAGTRAVLSALILNRNRSIYDAPARFIPERWFSTDPPPFHYAVFSGGPRACPGFGFGNAVLKVAIAAIVRRHHPVIDERCKVGYRVSVSLSPYPKILGRLQSPDQAPCRSMIRGRIRELVQFPE